MKKIRLFTFAAILAVLLAGCENDIVPEDNNDSSTVLKEESPAIIPGEAIVFFTDEMTELVEADLASGNLVTKSSDLNALTETIGIKTMTRLFPHGGKFEEQRRAAGLHKWYKITYDQNIPTTKAADDLASLPGIEIVEPVRAIKRMDTFDDPKFAQQWHYYNTGSLDKSHVAGADINVLPVWENYTTGNPDVIVAVIDGGIDYEHEDLKDNYIGGFNFVRNTSKIVAHDHGTHVAGTIAAVNNNGLGVSGVAGGTGKGDGCRIMSCQVFSGTSSATTGARARAYHYAAHMGASVLQCSYGQQAGYITSDNQFETVYEAEITALRYFRDFGNQKNGSPVNKNIIVFASGNDGSSISGYPAAHREFISVSSFGPDYLPTNYTNYGPGVTIAAPGGDYSINSTAYSDRAMILSTTAKESSGYDTDYGWMQGTSMACPHVSGVVALGLSYALKINKTFDYEDFIAILYASVNDLDYYIETCTKKANGVSMDLTTFWRQMGTGALDTWKFLMNLEGTPNIVAKIGEETKVSLVPCFGEPAANLTYTKLEISDEARELLGIEGEPYINNGLLLVKCTKYGSAKIKITAIAGGSTVGTDAVMGGTEFTREVSLLSRDSIAENGGWL